MERANQTGENIKVRVLADDGELFVMELGTDEDPGKIIQLGFPYNDTDVKMNVDAEVLKVEELISGRSREAIIDEIEGSGGFGIHVMEENIKIEKGYVAYQ